MAQRVTVRERIDPAITASLFANYRSSADAVMELVDNAIDSRLAGTPLEVFIQVHPSHFVIEARGGEGMGPAELERNYLRWVAPPNGAASCSASTARVAKQLSATLDAASLWKQAGLVMRRPGDLRTATIEIDPGSRHMS